MKSIQEKTAFIGTFLECGHKIRKFIKFIHKIYVNKLK